MALEIYGGPFAKQAALILNGCCHLLLIGDSQFYTGREFSLASCQLPKRLNVRWNYVIGPLSQAGLTGTYIQSGGAGETLVGTTTDYGGTVTDYTSGVGTPALCAPTRKVAFSGNSVSTSWTWDNPNTNGGWLLQRECNASIASASQYFPWPLLEENSSKPWFHNEHMKIGVVIQGQSAGNGVLQAGFGIRRVGGTTGSATITWSDLTIADTATIQNIGYTAAMADGGGYQTSTNNAGILNDHNVQLGARSASGYDETGKSIIFMRGIWARCDSGGTITWNNTDGLNSGAGYDSFGRAGAAITHYETNYWSQTQWQEYFTATVLVPNKVTVMAIMLGHNCVQTSGASVTAAFTTSWQNFITKIRAAYAAAFPVGTYPLAKLHLMIIMPWYNGSKNTCFQSIGVAGARTMQAVYEGLSATYDDTSWFSFFNYFNETEPFDPLHADNEVAGDRLGEAIMDAMHRATSFEFAAQGEIASGGNRLRGRR